MRIKTALILCAGLGKRLAPLTLKTPKPLLKLNNKTILEICISTALKLGVEKIFLNTFHLGEKISNFIKSQNFPIEVEIVDDGEDTPSWVYVISWNETKYQADNNTGWEANKSNDSAETPTVYDWNGSAWIS